MNPEFNPRKTARDGRELRRILSNPEYSETGLPYRPLSQYDEAVKPRSAPSTSCPTAASWTASSPQFTPRNTGVPYINDRFYGRAGRTGSGGNKFKPQSKSCCFLLLFCLFSCKCLWPPPPAPNIRALRNKYPRQTVPDWSCIWTPD